MNIHPLAKYFPILEGEEYELLKQDIEKNGQLEPIVMVDGQILDGVNRWRACRDLGIEPITEQYEGDDPLSYVISLNVRRRHLTISQRAMLATEMLPELEAKRGTSESEDSPVDLEGKHRSTTEAGILFGVSQPSVIRAKRVKEQAPERVDEIIKGKTTVGAVDEELRRSKPREKPLPQKHEPSWEDIPEVAGVLDILRAWKGRLPDMRKAIGMKGSPEAKIHIAENYVKPLASAMNKWYEELNNE